MTVKQSLCAIKGEKELIDKIPSCPTLGWQILWYISRVYNILLLFFGILLPTTATWCYL